MNEWHKLVQDAVAEIDGCIARREQEDITLRRLSELLGYSEFHTSRRFREISGMTLRDYIRKRRLAFALKDVRDTDRGIMDLALDYGFSSHEAFTHAFKGLYGVTPSAYRHDPTPVVLRTVLTPFDCYLRGRCADDEAGEIKTYFVTIPAHRYMHIRDYESVGYWDFWQRLARTARPYAGCLTA